jgi:hypothetical protein
MLPKVEPQRTGEMTIIEKRGGSGTRQQARPNPRKEHIPKQKVQGVFT